MFNDLDPHKGDVFFNSGWLTYLGVLAISTWGGVVSYMNSSTKFSWASLFAQLSSSSFAGLMAYWGCQYSGISGPLTGVLIGVASHMGTPALINLAMRFKPVRNFLSDEGEQK